MWAWRWEEESAKVEDGLEKKVNADDNVGREGMGNDDEGRVEEGVFEP